MASRHEPGRSPTEYLSTRRDPLFTDPRFAEGIWPEFPERLDNDIQTMQQYYARCGWRFRQTKPSGVIDATEGQVGAEKAREKIVRQEDIETATKFDVAYVREFTKPFLPTQFLDILYKTLEDHPNHENAVNWYLDHQPEENPFATQSKWGAYIDRLFSEQATNTNLKWKLVGGLGKGGYGQVFRFRLCNTRENNAIVLEVAVKFSRNPEFFEDYCSEALFTSRLNAAGCKNVIKVLGWHSVPDKALTKIAYELCRHGSLSSMRSFYLNDIKNKLTIPEPFLWHIFHSIATAICYNTYGSTRRRQRPSGWIPIVHRDIKLDNILIDDPDLKTKSLYPTVKLCDYGLAYSYANTEIVDLKRRLWSLSTPGIMAPEINMYVRSDSRQAPYARAGSKADVYSLGRTIKALMKPAMRRIEYKVRGALEFHMPFAYKYFPYSRDLFDLVQQCTSLNSRKRPGVQELYNKTAKFAEAAYNTVQKAAASPDRKGTYEGQVLWNQQLKEKYMTNSGFAAAFKSHDWATTHKAALLELWSTRPPTPAKYAPPDGHYAVGNGLAPPMTLSEVHRFLRKVEDERPTKDWRKAREFIDHRGKPLKRAGGGKFHRYRAQDLLKEYSFDKNWRARRLERERRRRAETDSDRP